MNILASYRYQMADHKKAILIFYLAIICFFIGVNTLMSVTAEGPSGGGTGIVTGNETASVIFLFVIGLCTFKETFLLSLQNGSSRKTLFAAKLLTMGSVTAIISAIDLILILISKAILSVMDHSIVVPLFYAIYGGDIGSPVLYAKNFLLELLLALAATAVGYFITIMFYRLNKAGKIIVGAGFPVLCIMVIPYVDMLFLQGKISQTLFSIMTYIVASPVRFMISGFLTFAVFSALAFLLMRKAVIKK